MRPVVSCALSYYNITLTQLNPFQFHLPFSNRLYTITVCFLLSTVREWSPPVALTAQRYVDPFVLSW